MIDIQFYVPSVRHKFSDSKNFHFNIITIFCVWETSSVSLTIWRSSVSYGLNLTYLLQKTPLDIIVCKNIRHSSSAYSLSSVLIFILTLLKWIMNFHSVLHFVRVCHAKISVCVSIPEFFICLCLWNLMSLGRCIMSIVSFVLYL
jgi:hypothetical protein